MPECKCILLQLSWDGITVYSALFLQIFSTPAYPPLTIDTKSTIRFAHIDDVIKACSHPFSIMRMLSRVRSELEPTPADFGPEAGDALDLSPDHHSARKDKQTVTRFTLLDNLLSSNRAGMFLLGEKLTLAWRFERNS